MSVVKARVFELFSIGWPNGRLPIYNIGPVLGEGGMDDVTARKFFDILKQIDSDVKVQFWNGLCASCQDENHPLFPVRDQILVNVIALTHFEDFRNNTFLFPSSAFPVHKLNQIFLESSFTQNNIPKVTFGATSTTAGTCSTLPGLHFMCWD